LLWIKLDAQIYFQFFDTIRIEDPRVSNYCNLLSEPSPYAILMTCLQKNYGLGDTSIKTSMVPARNQKNEFKMQVNQREVGLRDFYILIIDFNLFLSTSTMSNDL
jgi:hypothetical protein